MGAWSGLHLYQYGKGLNAVSVKWPPFTIKTGFNSIPRGHGLDPAAFPAAAKSGWKTFFNPVMLSSENIEFARLRRTALQNTAGTQNCQG